MKRRNKTQLPYHIRFESEYKVGDVVTVRGPDGRKQIGTFTLTGQFQGGTVQHGWWALRKWGSGDRYREENKPVLDDDILSWEDNNKTVAKLHAQRLIVDDT